MKTKMYGFRVLLVIALVGITFLAVIRNPLDIPGIAFWDKFNHFIAFGVLAWLSDQSFPKRKARIKIAGLLFYGFLIELAQYPLPYREFSGWDMVADLMGLLVYFAFRRFYLSFQP
ncbi:MAG: VanZ family protein [Gammaproteobacteria bacterium]|nr:VanZ family protein [Gammaproteobacteria bacterium]